MDKEHRPTVARTEVDIMEATGVGDVPARLMGPEVTEGLGDAIHRQRASAASMSELRPLPMPSRATL